MTNIRDSISEDNYKRLIKIYKKAIKLNDDELIEDIEYLLLTINKYSNLSYSTTRSGTIITSLHRSDNPEDLIDESVKKLNQNIIAE